MALETLIVIPARYASTRLPGKPLVKIKGKELILHVLDGAKTCKQANRVIVATDDERIKSVVENTGGEVVMTPPDLPSGGDRVAFVARQIPADIVINAQGDDPLVAADMLDPIISVLKNNPETKLALLAKKIEKKDEVENPNIVKMVFNNNGNCLYFSRSPIPYPRNSEHAVWYKHIGPYAWRRDFLLDFSTWEQTPLEETESLEMLRVLEKGYSIQCVPTDRDTIEIDTPEDLRKIETYFNSRK